MNLRSPAMMARLAWAWLAIGLGLASGLSAAETAGTEAAKRWERFEPEFKAFAAADHAAPPAKGKILFVGSSIFRKWTTVTEQMAPLPVLNRAFGGSRTPDLLARFDQLVTPYAPKVIVYYCGSNDLKAGETVEDPAAIFGRFREFSERVRAARPATRIIYVSSTRSPDRVERWEQVDHYNALARAYCAATPGHTFVDVNPALVDQAGRPRLELYVEDKLHFSEAGYDVVTSAIRWQKDILAFAKKDAEKAPPENPIVFTGSSSIVKWKSLAEDFPGLPVMNRGFGGSEVFDSFNYAHLTVIKYKPRQVVMYAGGNDINAGKTPQRVFADFKAFVAKVHAALPECRICYISNAPNPKRWSLIDQMKEASRLVEEYTKTDKRLQFINVYPHMLGADGKPKPDIFVEDQLHMNPKGYVIWKAVVGPYLK